MRNQTTKTAIKSLTSRSILGEYLHIPLHEDGTTTSKTPVRGTVIAGSEIDLIEAGDFSTNVGYLTLSGTQAMRITGSEIAAFGSLDTVENQMIVGMRFKPVAAPNGWLWGMSPFASSANGFGGYGAQYSSIGSGKMKWQYAATGTIFDLANLPSQTLGTASTLLFVIDVKNSLYTTYKSGVAGASAAIDGGALPVIDGNYGLGVGGRPTASDVQNILQNTIAISDFWMLRASTDLSTDAPQIAKDWANHPVELPAILRSR